MKNGIYSLTPGSSSEMLFNYIAAVTHDSFNIVKVKETSHEKSPILPLGFFPAIKIMLAKLFNSDMLEVEPGVIGIPVILFVDPPTQCTDVALDIFTKLQLIRRSRFTAGQSRIKGHQFIFPMLLRDDHRLIKQMEGVNEMQRA